MIDIHNHIIPAVDDGAQDLDMTREMLLEAKRQGVEHLIMTPHLYEPDIINGTEEWVQRIETGFQQLTNLIESEQIDIKVTQAAEVRFQGLLDVILDEMPVLIADKYLLLEFSFTNVPLGVENAVYELFRKGITPIIAHPERIKPWQLDAKQLAELINMGCLSQLDTGSFLGRLGPRSEKLALRLLEEGAVHICGSDSHNLTSRPVFAAEGHAWLSKHYGIDIADLYLQENPARIVAGENVEVYPVDLSPPVPTWKERISVFFK